MKKTVKILLWWLFSVILLGYTFSYNVKSLNSNLNIVNINATQATNYRQTCLGESNNDDNLRWAYYVGQSVNPRYGYTYSASNPNWARMTLDTTSMLVYNPSNFSTNWIFQLLSNITLNGGNVKMTKPNQNIPIINNTVWRNNLAGIFVLKWDYHTVLLGANNTSNLLWYRTDYSQNIPLYVQKKFSFVNSPVVRYSCAGYYIAKCGDGIVDNIDKEWSQNTDGKNGILVWWIIIPWAASAPSEVCDDWVNNGQNWYCSLTCDGYVTVVNPPRCTLSAVKVSTGVYNVNWSILWQFDPTSINLNPPLANPSTYPVTVGNWVWSNLAPTWYGNFNVSMIVSNSAWSYTCQDNFYIGQPQLWKLNIDKILLSTWDLYPGDFIDYKIVLKNIGSWIFYNAFMKDVLPASLNLISHSVDGLSTYTQNQWQDNLGNRIFEYSGFNLNPWQTIYFNVRWQIREGNYLNQTTNCAFTSWDNDCVIYNLTPKPYLLKSQRMSNQSVNTQFTTENISVNTGDYISYKLDFKNIGWWNTSGGVRIVDHMPLCVNYIAASIHGVTNANFTQTQDVNGRRLLEYNGFDLWAGQTAYVIITGQIMNTSNCVNQTQYLNNSYLYFYNPLNVVESQVTALKINKSIVDITKTSDKHSHYPWENKNFVIKVTNYWPNYISNIVLQDVRPSFNNCITYVDWTGTVGMTKMPTSLVWNFPWLAQWDAIYLYISWNIVNSPSCVNPNYENVVNLTYVELWNQHKGKAVYNFEVIPAPVANISLIKTADRATVTSWDDITYTISYKNIWTIKLNSYVLVDYWPAMVDFVSANPFPSSIVNFNTGSVLTWNFNSPLYPGQTWQIVIQWKVK